MIVRHRLPVIAVCISYALDVTSDICHVDEMLVALNRVQHSIGSCHALHLNKELVSLIMNMMLCAYGAD